MIDTLRSILVDEETNDSITLRAASERGTIPSALGLWWTLWRHDWLPHRWSGYESANGILGDPDEWGWRWHRKTFLIRKKETP